MPPMASDLRLGKLLDESADLALSWSGERMCGGRKGYFGAVPQLGGGTLASSREEEKAT